MQRSQQPIPIRPARAERADRPRRIRPDRVALVHRLGGQRGRGRLERYVHERYAAAYGADVRHFLTDLVAVVDVHDDLQGVIGTSFAEDGPLFLEQYLDEPVERPLSRALGAVAPRSRIAEVGNLASHVPGGGRVLVTAFSWFLHGNGAEWAVFTGTAALRNGFRRLRVPMLDLAPADAHAVRARRGEWGTYYDADPRVAAVRIDDVRRVADSDPRLLGLAESGRWLGSMRAEEVAS